MSILIHQILLIYNFIKFDWMLACLFSSTKSNWQCSTSTEHECESIKSIVAQNRSDLIGIAQPLKVSMVDTSPSVRKINQYFSLSYRSRDNNPPQTVCFFFPPNNTWINKFISRRSLMKPANAFERYFIQHFKRRL